MQRRIRAGLGGITLALALAGAAQAHEGAGGDFAVGLGLGVPTGLSIEAAPTPWTAFELAIGRRDIDRGDLYGHLTLKADVVRLARGYTVIVPIYLGAGAFLWDRGPGAGTDVGVRFPLGVNFDFTRSPLQLFVEGALEVTLASNVDPKPPVGVTGFGGVRVWF
jgi:hypothetical protein